MLIIGNLIIDMSLENDLSEYLPTLPEKFAGVEIAPKALDQTLRSRFESILGVDFNDVRIYTDPLSSRVLDLLGADAAAIGSEIFIRQGKFDLESAAGQGLLAHELTHVAQSKAAQAQEAEKSEKQALRQEQKVRSGRSQAAKAKVTGAAVSDKPRAAKPQLAAKDRNHWLKVRQLPPELKDGAWVAMPDGKKVFIDGETLHRAFLLAARMIMHPRHELHAAPELDV